MPDQNAELLRLQSGGTDLTYSELRPGRLRAGAPGGGQRARSRSIELGVGTDADAFWFCLKPEAKRKDPRFAFVQQREFRQAISHAVDREAFAQTVFLGEAVPIWGPITPGNQPWFSPNVPRYPHDDRQGDRELLQSIGLEDRNGNGVVEDAAGTEARFTVHHAARHRRTTSAARRSCATQAAQVGIALDIVPLEVGADRRMLACDYDAIYMRALSPTSIPPATSTSGSAPARRTSGTSTQKTPATDWEAAHRHADARAGGAPSIRRGGGCSSTTCSGSSPRTCRCSTSPRRGCSPRHSARLTGVAPSVLRPPMLWSADTLSVQTAD